MKCFVCGGSADTLGAVLLNADGDFACGDLCARRYEADQKRLLDSLDDDEAYASWWSEGGVNVKQYGEDAWKMIHSSRRSK